MKENIIIRLERENEYHEVENLVRESFWNVYCPGCLEHYVLHQLRNDPAFVPELDFVMTLDGQLIGQNMFMKAVIAADDGRSIPIMTMGPISIAPELKRKGYGKILLDYSLEKDWYQKIWTLDIQNMSWVEDTNRQVDFLIKQLQLFLLFSLQSTHLCNMRQID